ncbi:hypothetical protein BHE74_00021801 [Ensete ventricosum]|nr:hypothetical protein BHE74_00021801 [Ensete ventricosum]RZS17239.1 hypothetical protein BHM03_00049364 [Ensete ventricosum]
MGDMHQSTKLTVRGPAAIGRYCQNRLSAGDFGRRRSIEGEIDHRRSTEGEKGKKKKKKRKRRKKKKRGRRKKYLVPSSPAGDFSPA